MDEIIRNLAVAALPILFGLAIHEASHAYAARYFGDTSPELDERLTLNPVKHIDPFGTILLPLVTYMAFQIPFGYARPVIFEGDKMRHPRRDLALTWLAGPASNLVQALAWMLFGILLGAAGVSEPFPHLMADAGVAINLIIFALNILPIPPLDGGSALAIALLPEKLSDQINRWAPFGLGLVLVLAVTHQLVPIIKPIMHAAYQLLRYIAYPFIVLAN